LGWPVLLLSLLGILAGVKWDSRRNLADMGAWILACYITFTAFAGKETRYILYWLPPFMYFSSVVLVGNWGPRWRRLVGSAVALALLSWQIPAAWRFERPYVAGYEATAERVVALAQSGVLLFDGELPGNFVFFVRKLDHDRKLVVLRKALYTTRIDKSFGQEELVKSPEEILELLRRYGIRYIVVSNNPNLDFDAQRLLRQLLATEQFGLLAELPIESNIKGWEGRRLLLYSYKNAVPRTATELRIRMLTLRQDIVVSFEDLGIP
jgi:hypothetical protein